MCLLFHKRSQQRLTFVKRMPWSVPWEAKYLNSTFLIKPILSYTSFYWKRIHITTINILNNHALSVHTVNLDEGTNHTLKSQISNEPHFTVSSLKLWCLWFLLHKRKGFHLIYQRAAHVTQGELLVCIIFTLSLAALLLWEHTKIWDDTQVGVTTMHPTSFLLSAKPQTGWTRPQKHKPQKQTVLLLKRDVISVNIKLVLNDIWQPLIEISCNYNGCINSVWNRKGLRTV